MRRRSGRLGHSGEWESFSPVEGFALGVARGDARGEAGRAIGLLRGVDLFVVVSIPSELPASAISGGVGEVRACSAAPSTSCLARAAAVARAAHARSGHAVGASWARRRTLEVCTLRGPCCGGAV